MPSTNLAGRTEWESEQYRADGGMHARLAQSLIDLAHYIRTHTDLPIPPDAEITYCVPAADDKSGEDEAYRIAAILGTKVTGDTSSEARLSFGAASYVARYISRESMALYNTHMQPYYAALRSGQEGQAAA